MRSLLSVLAAVLTSVAIGSAAGQVGPPDLSDAMIAVAGHRIHVRCAGPAGAAPVAVLEAGGGGTSADWIPVQQRLAREMRTCAYDRAGSGASEAGPLPRTMTQEAFELHEWLSAAGIRGPIVLAGQSLGRVIARLYLERYDRDVAGLVLVDATHESSMLGSLRYGGWVRLREKSTGREVPEPRLDGNPDRPEGPDDDYMADELAHLFRTRQRMPQPLGQRPLIVLSAGRRDPPPGTAADFWTSLLHEKDQQAIDLSRLSANSVLVTDPASTHNLHTDNPALVARAIAEVADASRTGRRVTFTLN